MMQSPDTLHELVVAQAAMTPEGIALIHGERLYTYRDLDRRSNQFARHLARIGVRRGDLVGVCLGREFDLVAAILGILKSGGGYVPLDPSYPPDRLSFMVEDSGIKVLIAGGDEGPRAGHAHCRTIRLPRDGDRIDSEAGDPIPSRSTPRDVSHAIYTSGSSGRPKGVMIEHGSAVALVRWALTVFSPSDLAGVLASTSICFDLSVFEIFVPLSCGGTVVLAEDALDFPGLPHADRVTLLNTVPTVAGEAGRQGRLPASLRVVNIAGEPLKQAVVDLLYAFPQIDRVYNLYGPTEDTTYSTYDLVARGDDGPPSIGRPIAGTQVYLVDSRLAPVPPGASGELLLGGEGLARGYLRRPGLTAERFIPDPFGGEPGSRLYRTGDLARWRADGKLEYLGRIDLQVKVRGFRIEIQEIEENLCKVPGVEECAVVLEETAGLAGLAAFVQTRDPRLSPHDVRTQLGRILPEYMVPGRIRLLGELPTTPNGKIDRRALMELPREPHDADPAAGTPLQERVRAIWCEVLKVQEIGLDDRFLDLGGHSLLATRIASRVRHELGSGIPPGELFDYPTIRDLAARIAERGPGPCDDRIDPAPESKSYPVSFAQQRLWFLANFAPESTSYNVPVGCRLKGDLDLDALLGTLGEIVRRHDALRAGFRFEDGRVVQIIHAPTPPDPVRIDLRHLTPVEQDTEIRRLAATDLRLPFDLESGLLMRSSLIRCGHDDHVLLMTLPHIACDDWSITIFLEELDRLYHDLVRGHPSSLPDPEIRHIDYAAWQRRRLQESYLDHPLAYWTRQLAGAPAVLTLPTDVPRSSRSSARGLVSTWKLEPSLAASIAALGRDQNATPFMVLLAAFKALLYRLTGQTDMVVGSALAGRNHRQTERLIGFFINTLVLRTNLGGNPRFPELLGRVRRTALEAFAHQDLPFEKLVEVLRPPRDVANTPLFQVAFGVQNAPEPHFTGDRLRITGMNLPAEDARFDLTVWVRERVEDRGLDVQWTARADLIREPTLRRWHEAYEALLQSAVREPEQHLEDLANAGSLALEGRRGDGPSRSSRRFPARGFTSAGRPARQTNEDHP
ncbi:MAG: amino acid adenylation domain-containing protein [Isosphaeraceae bacterium]